MRIERERERESSSSRGFGSQSLSLMMLRGCCTTTGDLGRENFLISIQNPVCVSCKLQTFHSPSPPPPPPFINGRVSSSSLVFPRDKAKARVLIGFKLPNQRSRILRGSLPFTTTTTTLTSLSSSSSSDFKAKSDGNLITCLSKQRPPTSRRRRNRISLGFKLNCHSSKALLPNNRGTSDSEKKQVYFDELDWILNALDSEDDDINQQEALLQSKVNQLRPKDQTIILKQQKGWRPTLRFFRYLKSLKDYVPNVIHYNVVLRVLSKAQEWDELRLCWIDMARDGVFPTNNTYGMLIDVYAKAGLVNEALLWLKHMRQRSIFPDEVTTNTVVRVLRDVGELDRAEKFHRDWIDGHIEIDDLDLKYNDDSSAGLLGPISPKHFLSTELFKEGGRIPPSKMKIVSPVDMDNNNNTTHKPRLASTYNILIDMYSKAGRLKDASLTFAEMLRSGVTPDTFTFNTMIYTCGTHGQLMEAETLLSKMEERGPSPDTTTHNIFIFLYANAGNIDMALMWYRKIREADLLPDAVTHRAIFKILCERNMVQEVEDLIQEMQKFGEQIEEHSLPVIIRMYIGNDLLEKAKILLEKCQVEVEILPKTYAAIIDVYAEKGLWNEAELVFFRKQKLVGHRKDVVEYNVMIKAYGKSKLYDRALSLFKSMRSNGTWPDEYTYNSLVQMLSSGDLVDAARDLLVEMQGAGFKPLCATVSSVIASNTRLGRFSEAVDMYREMIKTGIEPNEVVYGSLINGFAEAGNIEEALHYFSMMEESGLSANQIVLTSLIKAYGKVGSLEGALEMYAKINDLEGGPDTVAYNSMIHLYAEFGMVSEAKSIFDKLKVTGRADEISFATMTHLYSNMGLVDKALDVAQEMQDSGLLRNCISFNTVMASYALNGKLRECAELLKQMMTLKILPDDGTFRVMFTLLFKGELPHEAVKQLESCYNEGKPYSRLAIITSVFSVTGLHSYALESLEAFMEAEVVLESPAYNVAIYAYGLSEKVDKALTIFMKMQDKGLEPDLVTFIHLVGCYGKAGIVEGVKRIHRKLKNEEIEPNESLFKAVIDAYKSVHRRDLAEMVTQEMKFAFDVEDHPDSEIDEDSEYWDEDHSYSETDEDPEYWDEEHPYSESEEDPDYWDTDDDP